MYPNSSIQVTRLNIRVKKQAAIRIRHRAAKRTIGEFQASRGRNMSIWVDKSFPVPCFVGGWESCPQIHYLWPLHRLPQSLCYYFIDILICVEDGDGFRELHSRCPPTLTQNLPRGNIRIK